MDCKTKITFYAIWAAAWIMLSLFVVAAIHRGSNAPVSLFDPIAWLSTFPVGWTAALIWARNRAFFARTIVQTFGVALFSTGAACYEWDAIRHLPAADRGMEAFNAAMMTFLAVTHFVWFLSLVPEALRKRKTRMAGGGQPLGRTHVEP